VAQDHKAPFTEYNIFIKVNNKYFYYVNEKRGQDEALFIDRRIVQISGWIVLEFIAFSKFVVPSGISNFSEQEDEDG